MSSQQPPPNDEILVTAYLVEEEDHQNQNNNTTSTNTTIPTAQVTRLVKPTNQEQQRQDEEEEDVEQPTPPPNVSTPNEEEDASSLAKQSHNRSRTTTTRWLLLAIVAAVLIVVSVGVSVIVVVLTQGGSNTATNLAGEDEEGSQDEEEDDGEEEDDSEPVPPPLDAFDRTLLEAQDRIMFHVVHWGVHSMGCEDATTDTTNGVVLEWSPLHLVCDSSTAALAVLDIWSSADTTNNVDERIACTRESSHQVTCEWTSDPPALEQTVYLLVACGGSDPAEPPPFVGAIDDMFSALVLEAWLEGTDALDPPTNTMDGPLCGRPVGPSLPNNSGSGGGGGGNVVTRYRGDWLHWVTLSPVCASGIVVEPEDFPLLLLTHAPQNPSVPMVQCATGLTRRPFSEDRDGLVVCVSHDSCETTVACRPTGEENCVGQDVCPLQPLESVVAVQDWVTLLDVSPSLQALILSACHLDTKEENEPIRLPLETLWLEDNSEALRQLWLPLVSAAPSVIADRLEQEFLV